MTHAVSYKTCKNGLVLHHIAEFGDTGMVHTDCKCLSIQDSFYVNMTVSCVCTCVCVFINIYKLDVLDGVSTVTPVCLLSLKLI
jgi:hypothetical protein